MTRRKSPEPVIDTVTADVVSTPGTVPLGHITFTVDPSAAGNSLNGIAEYPSQPALACEHDARIVQLVAALAAAKAAKQAASTARKAANDACDVATRKLRWANDADLAASIDEAAAAKALLEAL